MWVYKVFIVKRINFLVLKGDSGGKVDRYLNLKFKLLFSYFVFFRLVDRKIKKEVILLVEEIYSDYYGEVGLFV